MQVQSVSPAYECPCGEVHEGTLDEVTTTAVRIDGEELVRLDECEQFDGQFVATPDGQVWAVEMPVAGEATLVEVYVTPCGVLIDPDLEDVRGLNCVGEAWKCAECGDLYLYKDLETAEACCREDEDEDEDEESTPEAGCGEDAEVGATADVPDIEEVLFIGPEWTDMATRASWKTEPIERPRPIPIPGRVYTDAEWRRIQYGFVPTDIPGHKWFAFVEGHRLYLHLSLTGRGVFEAAFERSPAGWRITEALTKEFSVLGLEDPEEDSLYLASLIDGLLLGISGSWDAFKATLRARAVAAEEWRRLLEWLEAGGLHSTKRGLYARLAEVTGVSDQCSRDEYGLIARLADQATAGRPLSTEDAAAGMDILERARDRGF